VKESLNHPKSDSDMQYLLKKFQRKDSVEIRSLDFKSRYLFSAIGFQNAIDSITQEQSYANGSFH